MTRTLVALAVAAYISGCAVVQPAPPRLDLPAGTATPAQEVFLQSWWLAFEDPVLTKLIEEAFAQNLDLRAALARIEAARSQVLLAQSDLAPDINLRVDPNRSRITGVGSQRLPAGTPLISNDFRVAIEMSYELDVWGKYRSGALAAENDLTASRYYRETVRIGVAAEVASAYFRLRAADAELGVLESTLKLRAETATLQKDRFEGGLIGEYEVRQAEAERLAVVADIARAKRSIGQYETAIAILTGRSPQAVFAPDVARGSTIDSATAVPPLP
ncbi:MAG: TolC family protein, partial [Casimicrobiaceae bacterium]